eukprot:1853411-Pyramimonas_sp.AAC.1
MMRRSSSDVARSLDASDFTSNRYQVMRGHATMTDGNPGQHHHERQRSSQHHNPHHRLLEKGRDGEKLPRTVYRGGLKV